MSCGGCRHRRWIWNLRRRGLMLDHRVGIHCRRQFKGRQKGHLLIDGFEKRSLMSNQVSLAAKRRRWRRGQGRTNMATFVATAAAAAVMSTTAMMAPTSMTAVLMHMPFTRSYTRYMTFAMIAGIIAVVVLRTRSRSMFI